MAEKQNYKNHVRWYPLFHFVLTPLLALNLIWQIAMLLQERTWDRAENLVVAMVLIIISSTARLQALKVQDRVIRLEESLRYKGLLSDELAEKAGQLSLGKMIALRFASDEELPELIQRTLNGEFKNNKELKHAIKNWRGDHVRA